MIPARRCVLAALAMSATVALAASGAAGAAGATRAAGTAGGPVSERIDWDGNGGAGGGSVGDRSVSYSTWSLNGDTFILRYLLPVGDAERVAGTDIEVLVQQRLDDYLPSHLAVRADGQVCPEIDQGYDIGRVDPLTVAAGLYGFEIFFRCPVPVPPQPGPMQLTLRAPPPPPLNLVLENSALFDRIPGHVDFARLQIGARASQQLFTAHHQRLVLRLEGVSITPELPGSTAAPRDSRSVQALPSAGIGRYAALGFGNVLGSLDRLCFLVGAVLLLQEGARQRGPRASRAWLTEAAYLPAGLAVGYGLSMILALAGGLAPRERLLDAAVGWLVALQAAQLLARSRVRVRPLAVGAAAALLCLAAVVLLAHARWPVLLLAGAGIFTGSYLTAAEPLQSRALGGLLLPALFGLLDGFVLPAEVVPMQLSRGAVFRMAAGFDLGALLAELLALIALAVAVRVLLAWPRRRAVAGSPASSGLATDLMTAALSAAGLFWMVSRLHG
ncbi:MAG TPA: hypothetical protein VMD56_10055 [Steroidobacteraceae bacterium]|nr:hypothetical protein [Steroidobacteraceae bacterium]